VSDASFVLDAPALLAFLLKEPGGDAIARALEDRAAMSAVNWAEVLSKVAETGGDPDAIAAQLEREGLLGDALHIVPLEVSDGPATARLRPATRAWAWIGRPRLSRTR